MIKLIDAARAHPRRALAICIAIVGAGALVVGWLGTNDSIYTVQQVPYLISGGMGGLFLLGLGSTIWVSEDLRDQSAEVADLAARVDRIAPPEIDRDRDVDPAE